MNAVFSTMSFSYLGEKGTDQKGPAAVASGLQR